MALLYSTLLYSTLLYSSMTAALEGGEWSAARPGRTLPPGKARYPLYRRLGGPQGRSGREENHVPTGIRSRTVQPVVSRYTDWATRPTYALWKEKTKLLAYLTGNFHALGCRRRADYNHSIRLSTRNKSIEDNLHRFSQNITLRCATKNFRAFNFLFGSNNFNDLLTYRC